ncbi:MULTISPECIES: tail fiber assembly protein [unclassified Pseudomonas]|uniref:tail fiber assembly protein n=1 Tax=unclassified Pseudomonas TaxID=196821 RepID=UPI001E542FD9|nr:tail fiber assembly protein [Pseudomonas sp. NMI1173_11]MCE1001295.1 tail fiber assembly protein [Pseudomonas sp. NMI1173_11]
MIIKLTPQEMHPAQQLAVWKNGEQLNINGLTIDLANLMEGATLPASATGSSWLAAPIERIGGQVVLTLYLPNNAESTEAERFPRDLVDVPDGRVALPGKPAEEHFPTLGFAQIDWELMQTAGQQAEALALVTIAQLRKEADQALAPLADAVALQMASEAEEAQLTDWQRYRVLLNRVPEQAGWPTEIDWPAVPA